MNALSMSTWLLGTPLKSGLYATLKSSITKSPPGATCGKSARNVLRTCGESAHVGAAAAPTWAYDQGGRQGSGAEQREEEVRTSFGRCDPSSMIRSHGPSCRIARRWGTEPLASVARS